MARRGKRLSGKNERAVNSLTLSSSLHGLAGALVWRGRLAGEPVGDFGEGVEDFVGAGVE